MTIKQHIPGKISADQQERSIPLLPVDQNGEPVPMIINDPEIILPPDEALIETPPYEPPSPGEGP